MEPTDVDFVTGGLRCSICEIAFPVSAMREQAGNESPRRHGGGLARATRKGKQASVNSSGRSRFRPRI